jgi:hypothetical protein
MAFSKTLSSKYLIERILSLNRIAWGITGGDVPLRTDITVHEAAIFVRDQMRKFYEMKGVAHNIVVPHDIEK